MNSITLVLLKTNEKSLIPFEYKWAEPDHISMQVDKIENNWIEVDSAFCY
jgi:hypothetical protein